MFESSVILEGSKTCSRLLELRAKFESSVILEGSKTTLLLVADVGCLRVVLF